MSKIKKLTILIDADDTIHFLAKAWVQYLNIVHGTNVDWQGITGWDLEPFFPTLTTGQVQRPLLEDRFWDYVEPIPGAAEYIKRLRDDGHDVFIVTASTYHTIRAKFERCIKKHLPFITWDDVVITSHKDLVHGDVIVDDGLHTMAVTPCSTKILFHAPHNASYDAEKNSLIRCYNWGQVYEAIRKIAEEVTV